MSGESWCTIESDPGVFTELIESIGVKNIEVNELWSIDDLKSSTNKVHGVIFLFKWRPEEDPRPVTAWQESEVFFAKQIVNNACATQAILSILMNCKDIELGETLQNFREFTASMSPELKGLSISNSDVIRTVHNSFSQEQAFSLEDIGSSEKEDVYHFISYIPVNGALYELDGLKAGPINLGPCNDSDWKKKLIDVISERIQRYAESETGFNLLTVVESREALLRAELASIEQSLKDDPSSASAHIDEINAQILVEIEKKQRWREENIRRKHNYIPFVINLLKMLADNDKLQPLIDKAVTEQSAKKKQKSSK